MVSKVIATLILSSIIHFASPATETAPYIYFCYYKSWKDQSEFATEDIDVNICTHVNFAFMRLNDDGNLRFDSQGGNETVLKAFGELKLKNPDVKLLITVGGWIEDALTFSRVAADKHKKLYFASIIVNFMKTYGLDGVDIDWVYPGENGGSAADKDNLLDMISVIRKNFDDFGKGIITIAVSSVPDPNRYNINALSKAVDAINVMTYDFHGYPNETQTGENSPLYSSANDTEWNKKYGNCDAAINNWLNSGADPSKLILGLGFYGHKFELIDPNQHGIGAPSKGGDENYIAYNEICSLDGWTEEWDEEQKVPYKFLNKEWIGYDNAKSIEIKVQYAKDRKLGGVMMWSINDDDFSGSCGSKNPLLHAIVDCI